MVLVGLIGLAAGSGCRSRRPKVGKQWDRPVDAGLAVVVVDAPARPAGSAVLGGAAGLALVDEQEPNDTPAQAQPFPFPRGVHGKLAPLAADGKGDVDCYQWVAQVDVPRVARLELRAAAGMALGLTVLDGQEHRIAATSSVAGLVVIPDLAVLPGQIYQLRVARPSTRTKNKTPAGDEIDYQLLAVLAAPNNTLVAEPNGDAAHAAPLAVPGEATGFWSEPHDEDWLRITATDAPAESSSLRLELDGVPGIAATLRVLDAQGSMVLAESRGNRGQAVNLRNAPLPRPAEGVLVVVRAESGNSTELGWLLRARVEPPLPGLEQEPNDTLETASLLDCMGAQAQGRGYLWPGDRDCWRVNASENGRYDFELVPPAASRIDLRLDVVAGMLPNAAPPVTIDEHGPGQSERLAPMFVGQGGELRACVSASPSRGPNPNLDELFKQPYTLRCHLSGDSGTP